MTRTRVSLCAGFLAGAFCSGSAIPSDAAVFTALGDLAGGRESSTAYAVSADGSVIAGACEGPSGTVACAWRDGHWRPLPVPEGHSLATAISPSGRHIAGSISLGRRTLGFVISDDKLRLLEPTAELGSPIQIWAVSDDGSVGGDARAAGASVAFLANGDRFTLLPAGAHGQPRSVTSISGSAATGDLLRDGEASAFRFESGVVTSLGDLAGGPVDSTARDSAMNGKIVVGRSDSYFGHEAFLWRDGVMQGLGGLSDHHDFFSQSMAVSDDGTVIVGVSENAQDRSEAFIWDTGNGLRSLARVLSGYGAMLDGFHLDTATDVSADGRTIVGYGSSRSSEREAWVARLPDPVLEGAAMDPELRDGNSVLTFRRQLTVVGEPVDAVPGSGGQVLVLTTRGAFIDRGEEALIELAVDRPVGAARIADAWVVVGAGATLFMVNDDGEVAARLQLDVKRPGALAADSDSIWLVDRSTDHIKRFDRAGKLAGAFELPSVTGPIAALLAHQDELFVVDAGARAIVVVDARGQEVRRWGGYGRFPGLFIDPTDIALLDGEIYVMDSAMEQVQVFSSGGLFSRAFGAREMRPGAGSGRWRQPRTLNLTSATVAVCEPRDNRCQLFSRTPINREHTFPGSQRRRDPVGPHVAASGHWLAQSRPDAPAVDLLRVSGESLVHVARLGEWGEESGQIQRAGDLAIDDREGRLWLADPVGREVLEYRLPEQRSRPRFVRSIALGQLSPTAIAVDMDGDLYVLDADRQRLIRMDSRSGEVRWRVQLVNSQALDIAVHEELVAILDPARIRLMDRTAGNIVQSFVPQFCKVACDLQGVSVAGKDLVYLADAQHDRIVTVDQSGQLIASFGRSGSLIGELKKPRGIGLGIHGVVVADWGNRRAQVFDLAGSPAAVFGDALYIAGSSQAPGVHTVSTTQPPVQPRLQVPDHVSGSFVSNDGGYRIELLSDLQKIPINQLFRLRFRVTRASNTLAKPGSFEVQLDARMPAHRHGMTTRPVVKRWDDGTLEAAGLKFHMPGDWEVRWHITEGAVTERAQTQVSL